MIDRESTRVKDAVLSGRRWADEKAAILEGTSPRDWPDAWDAAWSGELRLAAHAPMLAREDLVDLLARASEAARQRWEEIVEAERMLEESGAMDDEARAVALCEALRDHLPAGLSVGREGGRVYLQDVTDAGEMTVTSLARAALAIGDWQERHLGR